MQKITCLILILFSATLLAQSGASRNQVIQDIRFAAQDLDFAARGTQATLQDLTYSLSLITQAKDILNGNNGGGAIFTECREFSFPLLRRVLPNADALDEAIALCRNVRDMQVMRFVHSKLSRVMSTRQAVREAAEAADTTMMGKAQLLDFAFSKYNRILPTDRSIERSLLALRPITVTRSGTRSLFTCFQKTYPQFNRTLSSDAAMDRTVSACSRQRP